MPNQKKSLSIKSGQAQIAGCCGLLRVVAGCCGLLQENFSRGPLRFQTIQLRNSERGVRSGNGGGHPDGSGHATSQQDVAARASLPCWVVKTSQFGDGVHPSSSDFRLRRTTTRRVDATSESNRVRVRPSGSNRKTGSSAEFGLRSAEWGKIAGGTPALPGSCQVVPGGARGTSTSWVSSWNAAGFWSVSEGFGGFWRVLESNCESPPS
jgi:hypothetical protein